MKIERKYIGIIALVAVTAWVGDAAIHAYLLGSTGFLDAVLFREGVRHMSIEWFLILFYSVFTILLVRILTTKRKVQGELEKHLTAIETSMDGIAIFNEAHEYVYANDAYAAITGYGNPLQLLGRSFRAIYDDVQVAWIEKNIFPVLERGEQWHGELPAHRKSGEDFLQEATITMLPDRTCICIMRDITERKRQEETLRRSERFLNSIFDSIHDPFCILNPDYTVVRANKAYADLKNRAVEDIVGRTCYKALEGRDDVCEGCLIRKTLQSGDPCAKEKKIELRSGEELWIEIFTYPIIDETGKVVSVIEYTRDVTDRKMAEEERKRLIDRLEFLSSVDGLTGLLNRRALSEQLSYEIERARRFRSDMSVILCDMDNLKEINDTHGHLAGDTAIQAVSAILRNSLRKVDLAGRYGGDEFLLILPETAMEGAQNIAEKIRETVERAEVRLVGEKRIAVAVSMGIACVRPGEDIDGLMSRVDAALYDSKNQGRNRITVAA